MAAFGCSDSFLWSLPGGERRSLPDHRGAGSVELGPPRVHVHVPLQSARVAERRLSRRGGEAPLAF